MTGSCFYLLCLSDFFLFGFWFSVPVFLKEGRIWFFFDLFSLGHDVSIVFSFSYLRQMSFFRSQILLCRLFSSFSVTCQAFFVFFFSRLCLCFKHYYLLLNASIFGLNPSCDITHSALFAWGFYDSSLIRILLFQSMSKLMEAFLSPLFFNECLCEAHELLLNQFQFCARASLHLLDIIPHGFWCWGASSKAGIFEGKIWNKTVTFSNIL